MALSASLIEDDFEPIKGQVFQSTNLKNYLWNISRSVSSFTTLSLFVKILWLKFSIGKNGQMFQPLSRAKILFWNGYFLGTFSNWWPLTWFKLDLCVIWMALVVKILQDKTDLGYFHLIQFQVNICLKESNNHDIVNMSGW